MLALTSEPRELPDQNLLEWRVRTTRLIEHLAELRSIGGAPRFGLVDELPSDDIAVALREFAQGSELRGDGEVNVLPVGGDSRVESGRDSVGLVFHKVFQSGCGHRRAALLVRNKNI